MSQFLSEQRPFRGVDVEFKSVWGLISGASAIWRFSRYLDLDTLSRLVCECSSCPTEMIVIFPPSFLQLCTQPRS